MREYIKILVKEPHSFRHILALTFTNKATEEMKARIIGALAELSAGNKPQLERDLMQDEELRHLSPTEVRRRIRRALSDILHNYSEFGVSTIDSFFQQILRQFAKELRLPSRYELELDSRSVMATIVSELMQEMGKTNGDLTRWIEESSYARLDQDKGWDVEHHIKAIGDELFKENVWRLAEEETTPSTEPLTEEEVAAQTAAIYEGLLKLIEQLRQVRRQFEEKMGKFAEKAQTLAEKYGLTHEDFKRGSYTFFHNILEKKEYELNKTAQNIYQAGADGWLIKSKIKEADKAAKMKLIAQLVQQDGFHDLFAEAVEFHQSHYTAYISAVEVIKNIHAYGTFRELKRRLVEYRTNQNVLLISDTNHILRGLIKSQALGGLDSTDAPFIFEKVGNRYQHILLDEFQDTSDQQWHNLLPLVNNALAEGNQVLVVGDVKQSIYRWRNGNMYLLLDEIYDHLQHAEPIDRELTHNYRSKREIVAFNNAFFKTAIELVGDKLDEASHATLLKAYGSVEQQIRHEHGGRIRIEFLERTKAEVKDNSAENRDKWQDKAIEKLLGDIQELQKQEVQLSDMAIIVRTNGEGSQIANFLSQYGIKVISSESLLVNRSRKVRLLISVLKYLLDTRNALARTEILTNYLDTLGREQLDGLDDFHLLYTDHQHTKEADCLFNRLLPPAFVKELPELTRYSLYETIERAIGLLGLNNPPDAYIQRFQDLILDYQNRSGSSLRAFFGILGNGEVQKRYLLNCAARRKCRDGHHHSLRQRVGISRGVHSVLRLAACAPCQFHYLESRRPAALRPNGFHPAFVQQKVGRQLLCRNLPPRAAASLH